MLQASPKVIAFLAFLAEPDRAALSAILAKADYRLCSNELLVFSSHAYAGEPLFSQGYVTRQGNGESPSTLVDLPLCSEELDILNPAFTALAKIMPTSRHILSCADFAVVLLASELAAAQFRIA